MDHTFIINPLEEINYLFEYVFHLGEESNSSPSSSEMQEEKELTEMMEGVNLGGNVEQEYLLEAVRLSGKNRKLNMLMQSPRSIKDFSKFQWMQVLGIPTHNMMQKSMGRFNNYLNSMLHIMDSQSIPGKFDFVEIYPHTMNLAANCNFKQGEVIMQIKQQWILGGKNTPKTYLMNYLEAIVTLVLQGKSVFRTSGLSKQEAYINRIKKVQALAISIYIFEMKFIKEIIYYPFTSSKKEAFEWLYFKLLPENFDYHPIRQWEYIKLYHKDLAFHLDRMEYKFIEDYKLIKQLVDGQFIKDEFSFASFLKLQDADGMSIYQKYQRFFTPKNYVWTKLCEKTRAFQITNNYEEAQEHGEVQSEELGFRPQKKLIPFLDLFHHSTSSHNLNWQYDFTAGRVIIKAETNIKKGDLLYIKYRNITMNTCYVDYGFVDAKEVGWVDLNLSINFDMIQWIANELFDKKIKRRFIHFIQDYSLLHDLQADVRIIDYDPDSYHDHLIKKESVLQDVIQAYTEMTLMLLNKHDPQMRRKCYLIREQTMKHKSKKMIERLLITSLQNDITVRREKIERIHEDINRAKKNWTCNRTMENTGMSKEEMRGAEKSHYYKTQQAKEQTKNFNTLYHFSCVKTILATGIRVLQKILNLFQKNTHK